MKIKKTICDICGGEIDMDKSTGIGLFEFIKVDEKIKLDMPKNLTGNLEINDPVQLTPEKKINRISMDLCEQCATDVAEYISVCKAKKEEKEDKLKS